MDKEIHQFGKGHVLHQMLRILELEVIQIMPKVMTNKKKPTLHIGRPLQGQVLEKKTPIIQKRPHYYL
ncbi:unnamed protein product [Arabidopsis thaliana]|uniref:Uncharacterized protein n=1 Tax=Arabidopsis thaliana TaxID=3702 RepID=A0A5S9V107_ARATH|nr:unnamed protein product [Arabidopsis thaliana]VYS46456.1 unnamed protein product [Arabidopsis thaliana]